MTACCGCKINGGLAFFGANVENTTLVFVGVRKT